MVSFTPSFNVKRGVRQGDPLSPILFIIVLEILVISIPNNRQIRGIKMNGNEIKLVTFADDMTTFVCDKPSHLTLIGVINLFGAHSGLKINHKITEALLLGNKEVAVRNFMLHVPLDSIIESVIAVGGDWLWVSSVCWDTPKWQFQFGIDLATKVAG